MQNAISLGRMQSLLADYDTISNFLKTAAILLGMLAMILLSGYLFIYNMLYISISKDIRYYGQLKTIGIRADEADDRKGGRMELRYRDSAGTAA